MRMISTSHSNTVFPDFDSACRGCSMTLGRPELWQTLEATAQLAYCLSSDSLRQYANCAVASNVCHSSGRPSVIEQPRQAESKSGKTVFEWLVDIILIHCPGGAEHEDGIELD